MILPMPSLVCSSLVICAFSVLNGVNAAAINNTSILSKNTTTITTGVQNVPIDITLAAILDSATDDEFNAGIYRDGGGGGYVNGYHVAVFCDSWTTTTASPAGLRASGTSFVHNTITYMGVRNATDPTKLYDFGAPPNSAGNRTFLQNGMVATGNETKVTGTQIGIWPSSNLIPMLGTSNALAVYPVYNITGSYPIYNTMVQITISDPGDVPMGHTLNATRIVPRLFYNGENQYGSFGIYRAGTLPGEPIDPNLYLFSTSGNGIKVARVGLENKAKRHYYWFWNGQEWSTTQPAVSDTSADIIPWSYINFLNQVQYGPASGDIFWSVHFQTFVCIFMGDAINDGFFMSYSKTQKITGPWSTPQQVYAPPYNPNCIEYSPNWLLNYAGHAYPMWDQSGKTLMLSWSSCNAWITMAQLTFA